MKPQDPMRSTTSAPAQFEALLFKTTAELTAYRKTSSHALDIGVRPRELVRYARGDLDEVARVDFQRLLTQSPWALGRVVAIVKAQRVGSDYESVLNNVLATDVDTKGALLLDLV